jgi:hypothetical protein
LAGEGVKEENEKEDTKRERRREPKKQNFLFVVC